jgi:hypothetical protein
VKKIALKRGWSKETLLVLLEMVIYMERLLLLVLTVIGMDPLLMQ